MRYDLAMRPNSESADLTTATATLAEPAPPGRPEPAGTGRQLLFVDNLRVYLTVLVVLHHLMLTYAAVGPWYYMENPHSTPTQLVGLVFVLCNQAYFMGFFFFLSGYFTPASYARKGTVAFVRDRLLRLGIPFAAFYLLLGHVAGLGLPYSDYAPKSTGPQPWWKWFDTGSGPLWFVGTLLLFTLCYVAWRAIARRGQDAATVALVRPQSPPRFGAIVAFVAVVAVASFAIRLVFPIGRSLPIPVFDLPTPSHLVQYVLMFALGFVAYRRDWLTTITDRMGKAGFASAAGVTLVLFPLALTGLKYFSGGLAWQAFCYTLWEAVFCVGMCLGLITFFRNRLNRQGRLARMASANAYTVYVVHAPVIVGVALAFRWLDIAPLLKFVVVAPVALAACLAVAYLIRLIPGVRRVL